MRLIIEGPDGKGLFPSKRLKLSVGIAALMLLPMTLNMVKSPESQPDLNLLIKS